MQQRKKYMLDRKFQLKTTLSMTGILFAGAIIIIAVIGSIMAVNNSKLQNVIIINNNIVDSLLTFSQDGTSTGNSEAVRRVSMLHDENVATLQKIIRRNTRMLFGIIVIFVLLGAGVFLVLIRKTHHISGPVYVMSNYIRQIIDGTLPETRSLRKNDELKEFHGLLCAMIEEMKKKKQ